MTLGQTIPRTRPEARTAMARVIRFVRERCRHIQGVKCRRLRFLSESLLFHSVQGTLAVVWDGPQVVGVGLCYQTNEEKIRRAHAGDASGVDWQPTDPAGDSVYLAFVGATVPAAVPVMARYFLNRFPHWKGLQQFGTKRDNLVKFNMPLLERLAERTSV